MKNPTFLLGVLILSGCSMVPDYLRPDVLTTAPWRDNPPALLQNQTDTGALANFWAHTQNDELRGLVAKALQKNLDIQAALARIDQARGRARIAGAPLLPSVGATGSLDKTWTKNEGKTVAVKDSGQVGLSVSYELDLFGKNHAAAESADYAAQASVFDHDALALVTSADVAKTYITVLALQDRLEVANRNLENAREVLKIVETQFKVGTTSALEVARQKTDLANTGANIATLIQQRSAALDALAVLEGEAPQSFQVSGKNLNAVQAPLISPLQPSTLLERRPDIRSAEAGLQAANADIGAARAAFFPSIDLGAALSALATPVTGPITSALTVGAGLTAPIFSGGSLEGQLDVAHGRQKELVANYQKTVLVSFQEVQDALSALKAADQRLKNLATAVEQSNRAYRLARDQYKAGAIDFVTLLDTQRDLLQAEDSLVQARQARLIAAIDLFRAMGGAWKENGTAPAA